jgi:hypothetical protein
MTNEEILQYKIDQLDRKVSVLTDTIFELLKKTNITVVGRNDIIKILGWSPQSFYYKKDALFPFGLKKDGQWKMPLSGLNEYKANLHVQR